MTARRVSQADSGNPVDGRARNVACGMTARIFCIRSQACEAATAARQGDIKGCGANLNAGEGDGRKASADRGNVGYAVQIEEMWATLNLLRQERHRSFQQLAEEALRDLLAKYEKPIKLKDQL